MTSKMKDKIKDFSFGQKILLTVVGLVVGFLLGAFTVFNVFFLLKVLPHAGF